MNKNIFRAFVPIFAVILLSGIASGYYYGDYKKEYTVKETYDDYGYSFYEKSTKKDPWGEKTVYTKIKDYDGYRPYYDRYNNRLYDYWKDGPYEGYSRTYQVVESRDDRRYLGYGWDDAYRRDVYGSQYHPYYYEPRYYYNGNNYNWEGKNEPRCANVITGRCNNVRYCGTSVSYCSW